MRLYLDENVPVILALSFQLTGLIASQLGRLGTWAYPMRNNSFLPPTSNAFFSYSTVGIF